MSQTPVMNRASIEKDVCSKSRIILVAPHSDDAAYSTAGLLLSDIIDPHQCLLVTLFTTSNYAPYFSATAVSEVSCQRRKEEAVFAATMGMKWIDLKGKEAPLRLRIRLEEIFDPRTKEDPDWVTKSRFLRLCAAENWDVCIAPLGIGSHIDHVIARQWVESFSFPQVWLYEDLPYAGEMPLEEYQLTINALTPGLHPFLVKENGWLESKLTLLRIYASQVSEKDVRNVVIAAERLGGERFWKKITGSASLR